jgi:hypothetical protein
MSEKPLNFDPLSTKVPYLQKIANDAKMNNNQSILSSYDQEEVYNEYDPNWAEEF